jgi:hypothetical protein
MMLGDSRANSNVILPRFAIQRLLWQLSHHTIGRYLGDFAHKAEFFGVSQQSPQQEITTCDDLCSS